jgi:hypothetical protein
MFCLKQLNKLELKHVLCGWRVVCTTQRNYASKAKKKTEAVSSEIEAKPKPKRVVKKADPAEVTLKDIVTEMEKELQNNQKKIGLVLGLDVNSKVTGYSVLNGQTGEVLDCGSISTEHLSDPMDKCLFLGQQVAIIKQTNESSIKKGKNIGWIVGIEDPLKFFIAKSSQTPTIKTLLLLYKINSIFQFLLWQQFGEKPIPISFAKARGFFDIATKTSKEAKKLVWEYAAKSMPKFEWKLNRTGAPQEANFDVSDSVLVARYAIKCFRENETVKNSVLMDQYKAYYARTYAKVVNEIRSLGGKKSDKKVEELLQEKAYAKVCNVSEKLSVPEKSSSLQKTKCFF